MKMTWYNRIAQRKPGDYLDEVVIVEGLAGIGNDDTENLYRLTSTNVQRHSLSVNFRVYPNPIRSNSTLSIELNQKQYGDHLLQLFNQSGQLILSKDIYIDEKAKLFTMNMPSIISGNYFLKLTSKATGRSYTEKLIVE